MNIAVFGGAFDPPHNGHVTISRELLSQHIAEQVWLLPVKYHAFEKKLTADEHRLAMLNLIVEKSMCIELYEMEQESTNYTYKTLKALASKYPEHTFSFVIGSDNLALFHRWDDVEKLVEEFTFYVYPRAGFPITSLQKNMIPLSEVAEVDVSSTQVREIVSSGSSISELVPAAVEQYIHDHNLYR